MLDPMFGGGEYEWFARAQLDDVDAGLYAGGAYQFRESGDPMEGWRGVMGCSMGVASGRPYMLPLWAIIFRSFLLNLALRFWNQTWIKRHDTRIELSYF